MRNATARVIDWTEQGLVPDTVIRHGIRRLLKNRIDGLRTGDCEFTASSKNDFIRGMNHSAIAPLPDRANEQHYEVPADFFLGVLGERAKYSCCYWNEGVDDLNLAEVTALEVTCERAGLDDGMDILELGCGWGSLTLWMARTYPNSRITAVSNSRSQQQHILRLARQQQLDNVNVLTCDMNDFTSMEQFDRIVSVEMFEHMRNYRALFGRVSDWLKPGGRFFMHIFCHRMLPYAFEDRNASDWMSRHFFSGGMMPSDDLPLHFQQHLQLVQQWRWDGRHYEKTANAWLQNMDRNRDALWPILERAYGAEATRQWWMRWRIFFMACGELFGYENGQEWWVSHYLFENRSPA
ncbi:MAG TPA: cyclopropane-fatty-acyl-phospholipid synthase family protein [Gammaproteobacteria bacterium]|nr:cyclopropane-fatty-acyl-phospholipid synthase family protein [Gammaproteobacteria bacterium]